MAPCPNCRICDRPFRPQPSTVARTKDHILPRVRGGSRDLTAIGVRNTRWICQECNTYLAVCFHCPAMLACLRAVAGLHFPAMRRLAHRWRVGQCQQEIDRAARHARRQPRATPTPTLAEVWPR